MFGGAFGVVLALQTFIFVRHAAVYLGVAALFFVAGAGAIVFGWRIIRVRRGAARMALGACSLLGFISLAWFGYALVHGFFSPLCPVVALDAVAGAVLCGVAVAPLERVVKARAELFGADIA